METGFVIVWIIALVAIAVLLVLLGITLRRQAADTESAIDLARGYVPVRDTLIFYHDKNCIRSTADGRLWLNIPGIAWETTWQNDLLRVEVRAQDLTQIVLDNVPTGTQIIAAYDFLVYRMTETGSDLDVWQFARPIQVAFLVEGLAAEQIDFMVHHGKWQWVPCAPVEPETLGISRLRKTQSLVAAGLERLDPMCVVVQPPPAADGDADA